MTTRKTQTFVVVVVTWDFAGEQLRTTKEEEEEEDGDDDKPNQKHNPPNPKEKGNGIATTMAQKYISKILKKEVIKIRGSMGEKN